MTRIQPPLCVIAEPTGAARHIAIPRAVLEALAHVRKTRLIDMADRETVLLIVSTYGFDEAVEWLIEHRDAYFPALARLTPRN